MLSSPPILAASSMPLLLPARLLVALLPPEWNVSEGMKMASPTDAEGARVQRKDRWPALWVAVLPRRGVCRVTLCDHLAS